jgi:hypothetical protein
MESVAGCRPLHALRIDLHALRIGIYALRIDIYQLDMAHLRHSWVG